MHVQRGDRQPAAELNTDAVQANTAFEEASDLYVRADRLAMLAWVVPLGFVLAFYTGRWAVTGRIRPFWPLKDVKQVLVSACLMSPGRARAASQAERSMCR